jgi:PTS system mannose-specific IIA component
MSVGVLLITHNGIGRSLLETATTMLECCPLRAESLSVSADAERDLLEVEARALAERLDEGEGLLVLTDLYGSTPANIANALKGRERCFVLTGVNLPMLVRVLNYPRLPADELAAKALSGGKDGVLLCDQRGAPLG